MIIQTLLFLIVIVCASLNRSSVNTSDPVNDPFEITSGTSDDSGITPVSPLLKPEKPRNVSEYSSVYQYCGVVCNYNCKKSISSDIKIIAVNFLSTRLLL